MRKPLSVGESSRRTLEERAGLRWPWLPTLGARLIARLPPTSRIRQAAIWRAAKQGAEAFNRRGLRCEIVGRDGPACSYAASA